MTRAGRVTVSDRVTQSLMLFPRDFGLFGAEHGEHQLGAMPKWLGDERDIRIATRTFDRLVKAAVHLAGTQGVAGRRCGPTFGDAPIDGLEVTLGSMTCCLLDDPCLDDDADLLDRPDVVRIETSCVGALSWDDLDEPGPLERTNGFAYRVPRDAELIGETVLNETLATLDLSDDDHPSDLVGHDLAQGLVEQRCSHRSDSTSASELRADGTVHLCSVHASQRIRATAGLGKTTTAPDMGDTYAFH
jgi:hypothetical protein